jgi:hypothetical protein
VILSYAIAGSTCVPTETRMVSPGRETVRSGHAAGSFLLGDRLGDWPIPLFSPSKEGDRNVCGESGKSSADAAESPDTPGKGVREGDDGDWPVAFVPLVKNRRK